MIRSDYITHFLAGITIGAFTSMFINPAWGILVAVAIGTGKELYDKYIKHTYFDKVDLACTALGGAAYFWMRLAELGIK